MKTLLSLFLLSASAFSQTVVSTYTPGTPAYINVKSYGATGDGVTNDTSSIQAAITRAVTTGSTVVIPCGTYVISSTLQVTAQAGGGLQPFPSIKGEGLCSVLRYTGTTTLLKISGNPANTDDTDVDETSYFIGGTISHLRLVGPETASSAWVLYASSPNTTTVGLDINSWLSGQVTNLWVEEFKTGIKHSFSWNMTISGNTSTHNYYGYYGSNNIHSLRLAGNNFHQNYVGVRASGWQAVNADSNRVEATRYGYVLSPLDTEAREALYNVSITGGTYYETLTNAGITTMLDSTHWSYVVLVGQAEAANGAANASSSESPQTVYNVNIDPIRTSGWTQAYSKYVYVGNAMNTKFDNYPENPVVSTISTSAYSTVSGISSVDNSTTVPDLAASRFNGISFPFNLFPYGYDVTSTITYDDFFGTPVTSTIDTSTFSGRRMRKWVISGAAGTYRIGTWVTWPYTYFNGAKYVLSANGAATSNAQAYARVYDSNGVALISGSNVFSTSPTITSTYGAIASNQYVGSGRVFIGFVVIKSDASDATLWVEAASLQPQFSKWNFPNPLDELTKYGVSWSDQGFKVNSVAFAALSTASNGSVVYCSDCTKATPCASGGSGALAKRINGAWDCN